MIDHQIVGYLPYRFCHFSAHSNGQSAPRWRQISCTPPNDVPILRSDCAISTLLSQIENYWHASFHTANEVVLIDCIMTFGAHIVLRGVEVNQQHFPISLNFV